MAECKNASLANVTIAEMTSSAVLEKYVHYYLMEIGVPTVCAFGLVGNILNLMVLTREKIHCSLTKMEKSAHIGLIGLAVSDFMFCFLALMFTILPTKPSYTELNPVLYYQWLGGSFITIFIISSTWLIVVMAGERYLAVCHPFKARKFISLKRTRITIMCVYVVCVISTIPLFFENVISTTQCVNKTFIYLIDRRAEYGTQVVWIRRLVWAVLFDFIPSAALLYFNACLIWRIHKAKKLRRQMAPSQGQDCVVYRSTGRDTTMTTAYTNTARDYKQLNATNKSCATSRQQTVNGNTNQAGNQSPLTSRHKQQRFANKTKKRSSDHALNTVTATLVAVVVLFLILVSPSEVLKFTYSKLNEGSTKPNYTYKMILHITNFMQSLNFSFNFVLYCVVNKSFRDTLTGLFCFCPKKTLLDLKIRKQNHNAMHIHELA